MQIIFMDEAGYAFKWDTNIEQQPFYVLSAVCIPSENISTAYEDFRKNIQLPGIIDKKHPLGQGFEIKGREVAKGIGYWSKHKIKRNKVRNMFLEAPVKYSGTTFVIVINKNLHHIRYANPANPYEYALALIFERLQMFLTDKSDHGIVIYDQNKRMDDTLYNTASSLRRDGSDLAYVSRVYNELIIDKFKISKILEFSLGRSHDSIGLQIADFFASLTYFYVKNDKPSPCGWWNTLESALYRNESGILSGVGYKEFPLRESPTIS